MNIWVYLLTVVLAQFKNAITYVQIFLDMIIKNENKKTEVKNSPVIILHAEMDF